MVLVSWRHPGCAADDEMKGGGGPRAGPQNFVSRRLLWKSRANSQAWRLAPKMLQVLAHRGLGVEKQLTAAPERVILRSFCPPPGTGIAWAIRLRFPFLISRVSFFQISYRRWLRS